MACKSCGKEIPEERVLAGFPNCIQCSNTQKYVGFMNYGHKTAGECVILNPTDKEQLRLAQRAYRRSR